MSSTILDTIAQYAAWRVKEAKKQVSLAEIKARALGEKLDTGFPFEAALEKKAFPFSASVKRRLPLKK